jgi:hypothetical protein
MYEALMESFIDTVKMIPIIFIVFSAVEFFEHRFGKNLKPLLKSSRSVGPILGAVVGIIPQCGFSVISTMLFAEGAITTGTLISVYLATSDEAIPVILAEPDSLNTLVPLIVSKLIIAISSGYMIDALFAILNKSSINSDIRPTGNDYEEDGCCGSTCITHDFELSKVLKHSFSHTFRVVWYIFLVSTALNLGIYYAGNDFLSRLFLKGSILQPVAAALVGLIPNCAASVAITQVFLKGEISFGSAIAGLSSSAGMGLIVLFKEVKNKKTVFTIILLLLASSIIFGMILNATLPLQF